MSDVEKETKLKKIESLISDIIIKEGYVKRDIKITPVIPTNANYLSVLHEVTVKGTHKDIDLFIKLPLPQENEKIVCMKQAFISEAFVYNKLSKLYSELQDEANIPPNERFPFARTYSSGADAIVMENLKTQGYITYKSTDVVSIEFAEISIKELAKFHALSFALQVKKPEYLELISSVKMPWIFSDVFRSFVENVSKVTANVLEGTHREKYESVIPILYDEFFKIANNADKIRCLCHGDYRPANIMTLETNGKPSKIIPIDYQHLNYLNPATDFIFFITLSTDQEFRKTYLKYLKDVYFQALTEYLKKFNIDVETVLPRDEFERAYKEKLILTLILVTGSLPFLYAVKGKPEFGDPDKCVLVTSEDFARKAKEFVEEYFDL